MGAGVWFLSFCPVESVSKEESLEDGYPTAAAGGGLCSSMTLIPVTAEGSYSSSIVKAKG